MKRPSLVAEPTFSVKNIQKYCLPR